MDSEATSNSSLSPLPENAEEQSSKKRGRSDETNAVSGKKRRTFESTTSSSQSSDDDEASTKRKKIVFRGGFSIDENDYRVLQEFRTVGQQTADSYARRSGSFARRCVKFQEGDQDHRIHGFCGEITSLPSSIGRLTGLQHLDLANAMLLRQLPVEIGDVLSLKTLSFSSSGIASLPSSIGRLKNLEELNLSNTIFLSQLPDEIGDMRSLKTLLLGRSGIVSLPSSIGRLKNLEELNLYNTGRLSQLPDEICNLNSLRKLMLKDTFITSLPTRIGKLKSLETLDLYANEEISSLPSSIGQLKKLTYLNLRYCKAISHLPDEIFHLSNLTELDLSGTSITSISSSIGQMKNLCILYLDRTPNLSALPDEIGNLSNLNFLRKNISELPNSLSKLSNLHYLIVYNEWIDKKKVTNEHLLTLAERYPQVVQLVANGIYDCEKVAYTLACNRARLNAGHAMAGIPRTLWPRIFHSPKNAFRKGPPPPLKNDPCEKFLYRIQKPDAIYRFLMEGRGTFVDILNNRKQIDQSNA